jgi:hypothetical protein
MEENEERALGVFQQALADLPRPRYDMLKLLIKFLAQVASHQDENLMSPHNIGIVFGPSLLKPPTEKNTELSVALLKADARKNDIVSILIVNCKRLFEDESEKVAELAKRIPNSDKSDDQIGTAVLVTK